MLIPFSESGLEKQPLAAEFFAGIGLARLGLEAAGVRVVWSNEIHPEKHAMYVGNFQDTAKQTGHKFQLCDISKVAGPDVPDVEIAWASFPCADLSLAGNRRGLAGRESSTFWQSIRVLREMQGRRPPVVVLENVVGLATSRNGKDLVEVVKGLNELGYSVDVLLLDARRFVPQSRPRLFIVAAQDPPEDVIGANPELRPDRLQVPYGNPALRMHCALLRHPPDLLLSGLQGLIEDIPEDDPLWWAEPRTNAFLASLSSIQAVRAEHFRMSTRVSYRTAYRRTRNGIVRWEIRADDIAGCLRTTRGGSSKQALIRAGNGKVMARWMTELEYARLMGAPDYILSGLRQNQALFGFGDAVVAPAVAWLTENYLVPLLRKNEPAISLAMDISVMMRRKSSGEIELELAFRLKVSTLILRGRTAICPARRVKRQADLVFAEASLLTFIDGRI